MFRLRNDLLWNGLGEKYFLWAKEFYEKKNHLRKVSTAMCVTMCK